MQRSLFSRFYLSLKNEKLSRDKKLFSTNRFHLPRIEKTVDLCVKNIFVQIFFKEGYLQDEKKQNGENPICRKSIDFMSCDKVILNDKVGDVPWKGKCTFFVSIVYRVTMRSVSLLMRELMHSIRSLRSHHSNDPLQTICRWLPIPRQEPSTV